VALRLGVYLLSRISEALGASYAQLDAGDSDSGDPDTDQYEFGAQFRKPTFEGVHDSVVPKQTGTSKVTAVIKTSTRHIKRQI
jgi:hypothetical protein